MLGYIKVEIGDVIKVLRNDSYYYNKLINTLKYRNMVNEFESDYDKGILFEYMSEDLVGLNSAETYSRLVRHFGINIVKMMVLVGESGEYWDTFEIRLPNKEEYDNGIGVILRINLDGLDGLISDKMRYNDIEVLDSYGDVVGETVINRELRVSSDEEITNVLSVIASDWFMRDKISDVSDDEIDMVLDKINEYKLEKESNFYSIDLPNGVFVIQVQLYDGEVHSCGNITINKCVTQYFINRDGDVELVNEDDFLV